MVCQIEALDDVNSKVPFLFCIPFLSLLYKYIFHSDLLMHLISLDP